MQATRIIAIRHGETAWNVDTRIQGQLDIPLNDNGRWQARRLARALVGHAPIAAVYSSDLLRAFETAQEIAHSNGLAVVPDRGLRERAFGSFEGQTFADLEARLPAETALWRQRDPHWAPAGGESLLELRERVVATVSRIAALHAGEQIALVAHGGVVDVLYRAATGLEVNAPRTWTLGNASINRLLWTPQGLTMVGWADAAHLDAGWRDEATA